MGLAFIDCSNFCGTRGWGLDSGRDFAGDSTFGFWTSAETLPETLILRFDFSDF